MAQCKISIEGDAKELTSLLQVLLTGRSLAAVAEIPAVEATVEPAVEPAVEATVEAVGTAVPTEEILIGIAGVPIPKHVEKSGYEQMMENVDPSYADMVRKLYPETYQVDLGAAIQPKKSESPEILETWREFVLKFIVGLLPSPYKGESEPGRLDKKPYDRVGLMQQLALNPNHGKILSHIRWRGCLQLAVYDVLFAEYDENSYEVIMNNSKTKAKNQVVADSAQQASALIVQVSHAGFPEIAALYDHGTRWRTIA